MVALGKDPIGAGQGQKGLFMPWTSESLMSWLTQSRMSCFKIKSDAWTLVPGFENTSLTNYINKYDHHI